jgi:Ca-activated chloride channel family protein
MLFRWSPYSETPQVRQSPAPCTAALRGKMKALVDELSAGGLTALDGGLALGIEQALQERRETNLVLLLSDGIANVGETDLEKISDRAARARQQGLQVSTLGVGLDYNETLMVEMATQGGGRFYPILEAAQIPACLMQELWDASLMGAREVTIEIELELPPGATVVALSAVFPVEQNGNTARIQVGNIPLDTTLEIVLRLTFPSQPAGARLSVSGRLRYLSPAGHELGGALNGVTVRIVEASQFERRQGLALPVVERVAEYRRAAWLLDYTRQREIAPAEAPHLAEEASRDLLEYVGLVSEERRAAFARNLAEDMDVMAAPASASAKARVCSIFKMVCGD